MRVLEKGQLLADRYEIVGLLGEGGMARVYEAWCRTLQRRVAIKFLRQELLQDEELAFRFQGEAKAAASLSHAHIVPIYDVGYSEGGQFIVMEYVDGPNLKQYLRQHGPLPPSQVADLGKQVAAALKYAHDQGIVHRDIKPHNILLTRDGVAKVADFGLARVVSESTVQVDRQALGSIHYCAPEQARGGFSTTASDIYSLGAVLYEMATGKVPFEGETSVGIAYQHLHEEPVHPRELRPDMPEGLERIILQCLRKRQGERYQDAGLLYRDLEAMTNGEYPQYASAPQVDEHTQLLPGIPEQNNERPEKNRGARKRKWLVPAVVFLAVLLLLGMGRLLGGLFFVPLIEVPDVVGMTVAAAERRAEEHDMVLSVVGERYSDDEPEGVILEQDPEPGAERRQESPLRVVVSLGTEKAEVPDLDGMTLEAAQKRLEELQLDLGDVERSYHDTVASNLVLSQDPAPGTEVEPGSAVNLTVSRGAPPVQATVPDLRGRHRNDAAASLERAKLKVGRVREQHNEVFARHYVISQSPAPNTRVPEGTSVELTVSLGPPPRPEPEPENDEEDANNE